MAGIDAHYRPPTTLGNPNTNTIQYLLLWWSQIWFKIIGIENNLHPTIKKGSLIQILTIFSLSKCYLESLNKLKPFICWRMVWNFLSIADLVLCSWTSGSVVDSKDSSYDFVYPFRALLCSVICTRVTATGLCFFSSWSWNRCIISKLWWW